MTVERLMHELKHADPKARVMLGHYDGDEILYAVQIKGKGEVIVLETEHDNDMKEEITAMMKTFADEEWNDVDAYMEMDEIGITPEMVECYCGKELGDHTRIGFETYGLI